MASRAQDWLKQAKKDLQHAKKALQGEDYEWACFSAQQAAEKAIKAIYQYLHMDAWGHSVFHLLKNLPANLSEDILEKAKILDKYYIPTRYPNSFDIGAPMDYFTQKEAKEAVNIAEDIIKYCQDFLKIND